MAPLHSVSSGRRPAIQFVPEPPPPGLAVRVAAAQILAATLTMGRPLEERFARETPQLRLAGLDGRDRALTRSIATASLRRLGTIRKALARFLDKGLPKRSGGVEWTVVLARAAILVLG